MSRDSLFSRRVKSRPVSTRSRLPRFEPLEARMLLSLGLPVAEPVLYVDFSAGSEASSSAVEEPQPISVQSVSTQMRVSIWTEERIDRMDMGAWVEAQEWPEALGPVTADSVYQLVSIPVRSEPRGGYFTIVRMDIFGDVSALDQIEFVNHARLESESVVVLNSRVQWLIDAGTTEGSDGRAYASVDSGATLVDAGVKPMQMRVSIWTKDRIDRMEIGAWAEAQEWPQALGPVTAGNVEQLISIPLLQDPRGGFRTIVRMDVYGDISALEQVASVDNAKFEALSAINFDSRVQRLIDAGSTTGSKERVYASLAESGPLIQLDDFVADNRFTGVDGSGYAIAVLDSGIDRDHPFFGPATNGVADRIVYDWDYVNNDTDASDDNGHGTHVTSIATSEDATNPGMAPGANIVALKVLDDQGGGDFADIETALQWVVANADAYDIVSVNMSLGDNGNYDTPQTLYGIADEISQLASMQVMVVSASGNVFYSDGSTQGVSYPAADANSLSVGAVYDANIGGTWLYDTDPDVFDPALGSPWDHAAFTTGADRIAPFSQRDHDLTTIMAPGAAITAAWLNGGTRVEHGTSMAAPHIAGVAVLAQQLAMQELGRSLLQEEFIDLLQSTATTVNDGDDENDNVTNTGLDFPRVDVHALGDALLDNHFLFDADDDPAPGNQKDDGNTDTFEIKRNGNNLEVRVNTSLVATLPAATTLGITVAGSSDMDTLYVRNLGDYQGTVYYNSDEAGTGGPYDEAFLYDTAGDDVLLSYPDYTELKLDGAYTVHTNSYNMYAYATAGGYDTADMYGYNDAGQDKFKGEFTSDLAANNFGRLYRNISYQIRAKLFDVINVHGNANSADLAILYDTTTADTFEGQRDYSRHYAAGYEHRVYDFPTLTAYADVGGYDTARLVDSALDDMFYTYPHKSELYDNAEQVYHITARNFDEVYAEATQGGYDRAKLHDAYVPDDYVEASYVSGDSWVEFYRDYPNNDLLYQALAFEWVKAYSLSGTDYKQVEQGVDFMVWYGLWEDV